VLFVREIKRKSLQIALRSMYYTQQHVSTTLGHPFSFIQNILRKEFMDFYSFLNMFWINENRGPEDDLKWSKSVAVCNKWKVVVFGRILFLIVLPSCVLLASN
jgi:uncharacterized membrane protein